MKRHVYDMRLDQTINGVSDVTSVYVLTRIPRTDAQLIAEFRRQYPNDRRTFNSVRELEPDAVSIVLER